MRIDLRQLLLVLLAGCTGGAEQHGLFLHTGSLAGSGPALVRSAEPSSQTTYWSDSVRRGDTTFVSRGRAVTTVVVVTDSQSIRVDPPAVLAGIPAGLFAVWDGTRLRPNTGGFTLAYGGESPATLPVRLAVARSRGMRMVTAMTGGARANYLTAGVFDMAKWKARMDQYDTPEIRAAVALAVSEGILIGNSVIDEPFNTGGPGNEANSWGPKGTLSKARVDSMCGYAKNIFPTLPQGVFQDFRLDAADAYRVCDFITSQYKAIRGSPELYRDSALALCGRDRHACSFSLNVLDGGLPVRRKPGQTDYAPGDCPLTTTGGRGTYFPNCRMMADQVRDAGRVLGSAGCFLTGWRYDSTFVAKPENQQAFGDVIATLARSPSLRCLRR